MDTGKFLQTMGNMFIDGSAKLGKNCTIGQFAVIEKDVEIGDDCQIGHNVVIYSGTKIGNGVRINTNSCNGKQPLRSKRSIFK